jgi:hypothetical protein
MRRWVLRLVGVILLDYGEKEGGDGDDYLQREICVDEIVEAREEDAEDPEADEHACGYGRHPVDGRCESSPAEPITQS